MFMCIFCKEVNKTGDVVSCSHGEALTFEPLLVENKEESFLRDISIIAVATVTQVMVLSHSPELKGLISLPLRVYYFNTHNSLYL